MLCALESVHRARIDREPGADRDLSDRIYDAIFVDAEKVDAGVSSSDCRGFDLAHSPIRGPWWDTMHDVLLVANDAYAYSSVLRAWRCDTSS